MTDERRTAQRQKTLLAGKAIFGANRFVMDCPVRDLSTGGAKLSFADPTGIPDIFELHLPSRGTVFRAEVRWRKGRQIGVKFRAVLRQATEEPVRLAKAG
jgi:PilZ domain